MRRLALLLVFASGVRAADDPLAAIHAQLVPMRGAPSTDARGATPALTNIKHQLRDWIESRIANMQFSGGRWSPSLPNLQDQLNAELEHAGLFCAPDACDQDLLGYLSEVGLEIQSGFLVVRTAVGIQVCGNDESAYIYEWTNMHWRRIWDSERNNYDPKSYSPQSLVEVKISPTNYQPKADRSEHLIVTTGVEPWCSSVWHPVYYRAWQTKSSYTQPLLLLDENELADIGDPIHARVNRSDLFFEFLVIADDAWRMPELSHYVLDNGKLQRTDPVALTPQNFVSFWLRHPWSEVSEWTDQASRVAMESWHQSYKGTNSEFTVTQHCTEHPDLWQVAADSGDDPVHYFLVRARPPYRFTMVAASDREWPDCTEDDPAIDKAPSLFEN